jgi:hypothetical protein
MLQGPLSCSRTARRIDQQELDTRLFVFLALCLTIPFVFRQPADWFRVYVPAAASLWSGEALYPNSFRYVYPPLGAFLAGPFLFLPASAARILWLVLNAAAMAVLWRGAWALAAEGRSGSVQVGKSKEYLIAFLGLVCGIPFALDSLSNQQPDLILGALVIVGCCLLQRGRTLGAATLFGLAAAMKCTPLLWGPYLAWRRQWRGGAWVVLVALGLNLLPDLVVPPPQARPRLVEWASRHLTPLACQDTDVGTWASGVNFNHSLAGMAHRLFLVSPEWEGTHLRTVAKENRPAGSILKGLVYGTAFALVLLAVLSSRRGRLRHAHAGQQTGNGLAAVEYSLVCLLMLLLSPMSSKPHFCTLVLPGFCLARRVMERRDWVLRLILEGSLAAVLVSNKDLMGARVYTFAVWYGSVFASAAVLYAGCCWSLGWAPREAESTSTKPQAAREAPLAA